MFGKWKDRPVDLHALGDCADKKKQEGLLSMAREPEFDNFPLRERSAQINNKLVVAERGLIVHKKKHFAAGAAETSVSPERNTTLDAMRAHNKDKHLTRNINTNINHSNASLVNISNLKYKSSSSKGKIYNSMPVQLSLSKRKKFKNTKPSVSSKISKLCIIHKQQNDHTSTNRQNISNKVSTNRDSKSRSISNSKSRGKSTSHKEVCVSSNLKDRFGISMLVNKFRSEDNVERSTLRSTTKLEIKKVSDLFKKRKLGFHQTSMTSRRESKPIFSIEQEGSKSKHAKQNVYFLKKPDALHVSAKSTARGRHPLYAKGDILEQLKELKKQSSEKYQRPGLIDPFKIEKAHIFSKILKGNTGSFHKNSSQLCASQCSSNKRAADRLHRNCHASSSDRILVRTNDKMPVRVHAATIRSLADRRCASVLGSSLTRNTGE